VFITLEGIEGCGKTTQVERLARVLEERHVPHVVTREPGGTRLGAYIRRMLLDRDHGEMEALTELLLYAADRAQHVAEMIQPVLASGRWVVCDRFADATTAYQGYGRGQNLDLIHRLNLVATQGVWPDLTVLLDCPVELGLNRARRRILSGASPEREDRFERQVHEFHLRVREGYLRLAEQDAVRIKVVDATLDPDRVHEEILSLLEPSIERWKNGTDRLGGAARQ
jgi:dTMP kinase